VPPPLLLPFAIVTLGIGNLSKTVVIALGSLFPILLNTVDGVRGVDPQVLDTARAFHLTPAQRIFKVILPAASPQVMVGLRTALSIAIILMVISEMQASSNGLGYRVLEAQRGFDTAGMFAGIIVIGIVGVVLNVVFVAVERRVMRWYHGARGL
jgi:ABC-type nitrate/sulfonate/bicarbonate transport system permease component